MSPRTLGGAAGPDADADFWRWASSRGVVAVRCESRDVAEGWRGIVATEAIERDAVVLRVPGALLMSARSMNEDTQLCDAFRAYDSSSAGAMTPADKLATHLLREASRGRESRWHEYISRLPRAYNLLCVWTRRERAMLQDPRAIAVADRARQATRTSWRRARGVLASLGMTSTDGWGTIRAWRWAHCAVSSRTVHVPFHAAGALCPVGDMFNYAPPPPPHGHVVVGTPLEGGVGKVKADEEQEEKDEDADDADDASGSGDGSWDEDSGEYVFRARRRYAAGEQIMLCYGRHTNLGLLEHYGFLLDGDEKASNPHDSVEVSLAFNVDGNNVHDDEPTIVRASAVDGSLEWDAVRGLRLWAAGGYVRCDKRTRDAAANGVSIGASNERKAFGAVVDAAALALTSTLATTARDDLDVLTRCRAARWGDDGDGDVVVGEEEPGVAPREWYIRDDDSDSEDEEEDSVPSEAGCSEVDPESNAGLALRWRLCHKRGLQRTYRAAAARVEEASGVSTRQRLKR